jgi:uncharacterized protein with WD repeat
VEELNISPNEDNSIDIEKKIKALNKKLRQIDELKQAKASGKILDHAQLEKLSNEKLLREEFKALEKNKK